MREGGGFTLQMLRYLFDVAGIQAPRDCEEGDVDVLFKKSEDLMKRVLPALWGGVNARSQSADNAEAQRKRGMEFRRADLLTKLKMIYDKQMWGGGDAFGVCLLKLASFYFSPPTPLF
jgi:hypothetical protein